MAEKVNTPYIKQFDVWRSMESHLLAPVCRNPYYHVYGHGYSFRPVFLFLDPC
jgi:hypothetical protein